MLTLPNRLHRCGLLFTLLVTLMCAMPASPQVRTAYSALVARQSGKCIDINQASWSDGAWAIQYTCSGDDNQQFTLAPHNGAYRVIVKHSGKCLGAENDAPQANVSIVQGTCGAQANQLWLPRALSGAWQLVSANSALCISVADGALSDVAQLRQTVCQGGANEQFYLSAGLVTPALGATVLARHSRQCLTPAAGVAAGSQLVQMACDGSAGQNWILRPFQDAYTLALGATGLCAGIDGASQSVGAAVTLQACSQAPHMVWALRPREHHYQLMASHSGQCLDIMYASVDERVSATQYTCLNGAANQEWSLGAPTTGAAWSGVIKLPLVPAAAANLVNGKVLVWSAYSATGFAGNSQAAQTVSAIFDPATNTSAAALITATAHDMFCPGTSMLSDGSVLVNGGTSSQRTSIYHPQSNTWSTDAQMNIARGYPGNATLSNGKVLTLGGSWSGDATKDKNGEVWSPGGGWSTRGGIPVGPFVGNDPGGIYRSDNHLWLFAMANGMVFHAGPSAAMHRIGTEGRGSVSAAGQRANDNYSMNGNAILVNQGKILTLGGAPAYEEAWASASAHIIEFDGATQLARKIAPMHYARAFHNSVILPNGQVIVSGGQSFARPFSDERSILVPELWDPATEGFTRLPPMSVPRNYHSVSLLLPDGRVLIGGGGLCGSCGTNHADVEIMTPPYLLNPDGSLASRPSILASSAETSYGGALSVTTDAPAASFSLVRLSSVTHSLNNDQRFIQLQAASSDARHYTLRVPGDPGQAIPGYYMLFAISPAGVPSLGKTVGIR